MSTGRAAAPAGRLRIALSAIARGLVAPPLLGAAWLAALAVAGGLAAYSDDTVQGVRVASLRAIVETGFRDEVIRCAVLCVALAVLIGAALGWISGILVDARARFGGRAIPSGWARGRQALGLTIALHGAVWLHDVAEHPQLYESKLWAKGGVLAALQLTATHRLGPSGVVGLGALLLGAWLLGMPGAWRARARALVGEISAWAATPDFRRRSALAAGIAGVALLGALGALGQDGAPAAADPKRPNVLVVGIDSWRADHLDPRVAPFMSSVAARGTRFERAYVSLPRTFPSWVTLLTGRHPHHHGVRDMFPRWETRARPFDALPARLGRAGWLTAVVSDFAGDIFRRIDLGFSRLDAPVFNFRELVRVRVLSAQLALLPFASSVSARRIVPSLDEMNHAADPRLVTRRTLAAIDDAGGKPFFGVAFYSAVHFPYAVPHPHYAQLADGAYRGRFLYSKANLLGQERPPDAADVKQIRALYDGAVLATDAAVKDSLQGLEKRGLSQSTIVVLTADHGETLFEEERGQGHGDHLFGDEGVHVPLVVLDPRRPGARSVPQIVRDVDSAPTLYALTGVPAPDDLDGRSLVPALEGKPFASALAYAESGLWFTESIPGVAPDLRIPYPDLTRLLEIHPEHADDLSIRPELETLTITAKHRMVRDDRHKLVYMPTRSGAQLRLFDTQADPNETRDLYTVKPDVAERLAAELWRWMLEDRRFERRRGMLLPRADEERTRAGAAGIRVDEGPR